MVKLAQERASAQKLDSIEEEEKQSPKKSSPLRRVREYQLGCGGSPSPKKVKVRFDSAGKKV